LRNIAVTAPYFHSGLVWDLKTAVDIMANSQLGPDLEDTEIIAFLGSLTGEMPPVVYPVLPAETATTPRSTGQVMP
jgi:cytochrome c peroxidase